MSSHANSLTSEVSQFKIAPLVSSFEESATLALGAKAKKMKSEGRSIINFGVGEPDFNTPDDVIDAAFSAAKKGATKYTAVGGSPHVRKAIAQRLEFDYGVPFSPDELILSSGGKQAIYHFLQATLSPGDEVLIFSPYWVSFPEMVKMVGGRPVIVATKEGRLDTAAVEHAISPRTRLCILNNPSNPSGVYWTREELSALLTILKPHPIGLMSDDTYYGLLFDGCSWHSALAIDSSFRSRTCVIGSTSKSYAMTGWRLGWAAAPKPVTEAMVKLQSQVTSNPSSLAQEAALYAVSQGHGAAALFAQRFEKRRNLMLNALKEGDAKWTWMDPNGAFYVFLKLGPLVKEPVASFCAKALENAGLCMIPGEAFGMPDFVRLSYALSDDDIVEGIRRLKELIFGKSMY